MISFVAYAFSLLALTLGSLGLGVKTLDVVVNEKSSRLYFPTAFFVGQALLSVLILVVHMVIAPPLSLLVFMPVLITGWCFFVKALPRRSLSIKRQPSFVAIVLGLFLSAILCFHFLYGLHRPSEWDEVSYHVPVMEEIASGNISFPLLKDSAYEAFYQPFSEFYGSLSYNSETYASLGYILARQAPSIAHSVYLLNFIVGLWVVAAYINQEYRASAPVTLTILLAITLSGTFEILLGTGLIDISAALYQLLACLTLILASNTRNSGWLWISLLCLGGAFGHKFTTAYLLPVYAPAILIIAHQHRKLTQLFANGWAWVVVGGGIWYLKNLLIHLNPVYPLYFGHLGMTSAEYDFLIKTLITDLKAPLTLTGILKTLYISYKTEWGMIVLAMITGLGYFVDRFRIKKSELFLILSGLVMLALNILIGSQVSRYVMVISLFVAILAARHLNRWKMLCVIVLIAAVMIQQRDLNLHSFWRYRAKELISVNAKTTPEKDRSKIGCVAAVFHYCQNHRCLNHGRVLNLWDAYAAVYYQPSGLFTTPPLGSHFAEYQIDEHIAYLYSNEQSRKAVLDTAAFHQDMEPEARAEFEDQLQAKSQIVFSDSPCKLYQLK